MKQNRFNDCEFREFGLPMLWKSPTHVPKLSENEVTVWCACLEPGSIKLAELLETLSADEVVRANRFIISQHRQYFIAARGILRQILGHYLQELPQDIIFDYQEQGKPVLGGKLKQKLFFNLAHSHGIALYAVCLNKELGVDIEQVDIHKPVQKIAHRFFSAEEYQALIHLSIQEKIATFFNYWTCKEAFTKAIGAGLSYSLQRFSVSCVPGHAAKITHIDESKDLADQWALFTLQPATDYAAALAIVKPVKQLNCYYWNL